MSTMLIVFFASFAVVSALLLAVLWAMNAETELKVWKQQQRMKLLAENRDAWNANRHMVMY